ncbi:MAG: DEAD/DEAH box helicase [Candidatus Scalindua sp.]|nr:DEAD/DEAH box helicase [Candidatus Scalindua sp.]MBT6230080.1 DEAD/DEAH box helicase [Candidatus Scalindua sp.]
MKSKITPSSISASFQWLESDDGISFKNDNDLIPVSAVDIVRIEFKGQKDLLGNSIAAKPSDHLPHVKFNRFPAKMFLTLKMPLSNSGKPFLETCLQEGKQSWHLEVFPKRDQILIDGQWFPLLQEQITEISELLRIYELPHKGVISLRQCLDLLRLESDYLKVAKVDLTTVERKKDCETTYSALSDLLSEYGFSATLYPYQQTGITWLRRVSNEGLGCILADEMGLGKTVQIIALLTLFKSHWKLPALIIVTATLMENWRREFLKFSGEMRVLKHEGFQRTGFPSVIKEYDVVVTSYDTAVRDQGMLGILNWGFIVLDEAQAIKNPETRRAISIKSLNRKISIAVTGTPVENRLGDLWSIMDFACSGLLGTRKQFEALHTNSEESARRIERIVTPLILRRRIADVADDLPEKIIISQCVNMAESEIQQYEELRQQIADEYGKSATLVSLIKLRQFCTHPFLLDEQDTVDLVQCSEKYVRLVEILEEIFDQQQKAIIFTSFTKMSDLLVADLTKRFSIPCSQIDGRTPVSYRQSLIDTFSAITGTAFLVLNPRAAGTGLNITAANHVVHYNLEWNPAIEDQASARAYRKGQTLPVTVHRLFYPNTVEEVIDDRIERKRRLADAAVVGIEAADGDTEDIARALTISPITK